MKKISIFIIGLLVTMVAISQSSLPLSTGRMSVPALPSLDSTTFWKQQAPVAGQRFLVLEFPQALSSTQKEQLAQADIQLLGFLPPSSYMVALKKIPSKNFLQKTGATAMGFMPATLKLSPALQHPERHPWIEGNNGRMQVLIKVSSTMDMAAAKVYLQEQGIALTDSPLEAYNILNAEVPSSGLLPLADIAFVEYLEPAHTKDKPLNDETRMMSRANVAWAPINVGGYNLQGDSITVGVGDDGDPTNHVDLDDKRIINRSGFFYNHHATHVTGTLAGAGIGRVLTRGYAPHARVVSQLFGGIYLNAPTYVNEFGMSLTNNSYGNIENDSTYEGFYNLYSQVLDQQAYQLPGLLHVFASGNDGDVQIPVYPHNYANILSGYQCAKNVVTVGRTDRSMYASGSSSSGPVRDGRTKPELMALGEDVVSCLVGGYYGPAWGTSMAAPGVTGSLALMEQQYKRQFGTTPKGGLMKAIAMNGGLDIGLPGVDFRHGYGMMDLERGLDIIKNNHFYTGSITTGAMQSQNITVPANTSQLKVMLYWHDPAAAPFATRTLVNDLDLEVLDASSNIIYPQKLDTLPTNVNHVAITGADHINNNEQVVVNNPSGNYTIRVKGTAVNINPSQEYYVAYDFLQQGLRLTSPYEQDTYTPGSLCMIHWRDQGTAASLRKLEYSLDDGANWTVIATDIPDTARFYRWTMPNTPMETVMARIRLTEQTSGLSTITGRFIILPEMSFLFSDPAEQCEGYVKLYWSSISTAPDVDYQVLMKRGPDMEVVATSTGTSFVVKGLSKDSFYVFAVRARKAGLPGRRTNGFGITPSGGACSMGISAGDLKLDAIASPVTGRIGTASALTAASHVDIVVKNLDVVPITGFTVSYSINGGAFVSQNVAAVIAAQSTYTYSFTGIDLSQPGTYKIVAVVKNNAIDVNAKNDTSRLVVKQLKNPIISLFAPLVEGFETAPVIDTAANVIGLDSLDRWDFTHTDPKGRLRTNAETGNAYRGNRAITLDVLHATDPGSINYLIGTFNMIDYHAATDEVRLDLRFKQHGSYQKPDGNNRIWVRGNENASWIEVYQLDVNQPAVAGEWKLTTSIDMAAALKAASQEFSSSTQIRIGQKAVLGRGDDAHYGGYTIDDIRLYIAVDDVEAIAITGPSPNGCALGGSTQITVNLKNKMSAAINNVPIHLQADGGPVINETVPTVDIIASGTNYTFSTPVNLSAFGGHTIKVWVTYPTDNVRDNDTVTTTIINQPIISTFPYLQDFESSNGNYYAGGTNSSWGYGQPIGIKQKTAASGSKVWKTGLQGYYNDEEYSYLYSPCFDVRSMTNPTLSLSMNYNIEYCGATPCDGAWIEYSSDGNTWTKLGSNTTGYNWYNNVDGQLWDSTKAYWHVATTALPTGAANLRLRFVMASDIFTGGDGLSIDDIHIYDKQMDIYDGPTNSGTITQTLSGTNGVQYTDAGKLMAIIYPNGNNLGTTPINTYLRSGPVLYKYQQYYANRNITVKPATINAASPVTVRMYFLDTEADAMRAASGCIGCVVPTDYTKLGIIKYDDVDDNKENRTMDDNGIAYIYLPSSQVKKVPYGKGYYAEFQVNSFSEFWLSEGTNVNLPLPAQWMAFTAEKTSTGNVDALLKWTVTNEANVQRYEVEVSLGSDRVATFTKIFSVDARNGSGGSNYVYTDVLPGKNGVRYYRIKRIDKDGSASYSEMKILLFGSMASQVLIYPNPVKDRLQLVFQENAGAMVQLQLFDATGKILLQKQTTASGSLQKEQLDLSPFAAGVYSLKVMMKGQEEVMKVVKE